MNYLPTLLGVAVLLPLSAFFVNLFLGHALRRKGQSKLAAFVSLSAIAGAALLSFISLFVWLAAENGEVTNRAALSDLKKANKDHLQHLEEQASSNDSHHDHEDQAHDVEAEQASALLGDQFYTALVVRAGDCMRASSACMEP